MKIPRDGGDRDDCRRMRERARTESLLRAFDAKPPGWTWFALGHAIEARGNAWSTWMVDA